MIAEELEQNVARGTHILDRVFVPVDYSMNSHRAVGVAMELMRCHGSAVCLFHAVDATTEGSGDALLSGIGSPAMGHNRVADSADRLRRFVENVAPGPDAAGFRSRVEVLAKPGAARDTLRAAAVEWRASLIVAPADVHSRLLRSRAERLVHENEIPVLVIPTEAPAASVS